MLQCKEKKQRLRPATNCWSDYADPSTLRKKEKRRKPKNQSVRRSWTVFGWYFIVHTRVGWMRAPVVGVLRQQQHYQQLPAGYTWRRTTALMSLTRIIRVGSQQTRQPDTRA